MPRHSGGERPRDGRIFNLKGRACCTVLMFDLIITISTTILRLRASQASLRDIWDCILYYQQATFSHHPLSRSRRSHWQVSEPALTSHPSNPVSSSNCRQLPSSAEDVHVGVPVLQLRSPGPHLEGALLVSLLAQHGIRGVCVQLSPRLGSSYCRLQDV